MDVRALIVGAGTLALIAIALGTAVLLGESARIPPARESSSVIAEVSPEAPPAADQRGPIDDAATPATGPPGAFPEPPPTSDVTPAPSAPPLVEQEAPPPTPPPVEQPPPPVVEEPPAERAPPAARRERHPAEEAPPPVVEAPPPPKPAPPRPRPPVVDHRYDGVLTGTEIGRLKRSLRLSPDQEPYWPPVASVLREVGRHQMAQVDAGQRPSFDLPGDLSSRLYSAAMPLLGTLREDQKEVVRQHARSLGLGSVASFI